jgi:hyperosmotically inducible periplasmic protein
MRVLRMLFALVLLAGLAFLLFGYWAGTSVTRGGGSRPSIGTTGIDTGAARERAAELGERAAVASARAGDAVRDASVTTKIKAKMTLDDLVKARSIDVATDGSTVTLSGRVHSNDERDRAVRLARETEGVQQVVDRLRLEP